MPADRSSRAVYRSRAVRRRRRHLLPVLVALAVLAVGVAVAHDEGGRRVVYDRAAVASYADRWALRVNPAYWHSDDDDCADFVSQCVAAGGLRSLAGSAGTWSADGTRVPSSGWINCAAQQRVWSEAGGGALAPYIVSRTATLPRDWAVGDVVYLGKAIDGVAQWQHVIICVGKKNGRWLYDSHTVAHRRLPMSTWYPAHFSLIRYCHLADAVRYR